MDLEAFHEALDRVPPDRRHDLVFENVQARLRTFLLMSRGFVVGTGDLSEQALGWCTYNGDHMSMYNPNCSIPKTLVRFLVRYVARHEFAAGPVRDTLLSIADTTISPELLPAVGGGRDRAVDRGRRSARTSCTTSSCSMRSAAAIRPRRSSSWRARRVLAAVRPAE